MTVSARRRRALSVLALFAAIGLLSAVPTPSSGAPVAGSAGTSSGLPATDSRVTVRGRGPFASLEVTVNQTRKLVNQAVGVTWKGATPTKKGPGVFAAHYLQIMQCWGDSDASVPDNPGPPPEQCVQGATNAVYGGRLGNLFPPGSFASDRIVSRQSWPGFDPTEGHLDERTGYLWKPFRAVDGEVTNVGFDPTFNPSFGGGDYWLNPNFNAFTTNEIVAAQTRPNGEGEDIFEVATGAELSGLGCGSKAEPVGGGSPRIPKCWLVVVPRGSPAEESVGTANEANPDQAGVVTSPLSRNAWRNRIAIPLEFNPVDTFCTLSGDQSRLAGTELVSRAVASWQPKLCAEPGLPPYSYSRLSDSNARRQLLSGAFGAPGMVVVSRPYDPAAADPANPVVYAPLTLSAVVLGVNVERLPRANPPPAPEVEALRSVRVTDINLTPRLVAKLLAQSYRSQVQILGSQPPGYGWMVANPQHLGRDPDFLQFNPEFELLENGGKNFGGLVMSSLSGDVPLQVWEWVLADPEARTWLGGAADQWGMKVNPVYATTAQANSTGIPFGDPVPDTFPKSDPYCYQGAPVGTRAVVPPLICSAEWLPLAPNMREAARGVRVADDGARTSENPDAGTAETAYKRDGSQPLGSRTILAITDSPSAVQYGLQVARLSRVGDNGTGRRFIAPDAAGLTAGFESMAPKAEPAVREPTPNASAPAAYPLTSLTYAAVAPLALAQKARSDYAGFVEYAVGRGQEPGLEFGQLPGGFQPLPSGLKAQALAAAKTIRELQPSPEETSGPGESGGSTSGGSSTAGGTPAGGGPSSSSSSSSRSGGSTGGSPTSTDTPTASPAPASTVRLDVKPQTTPILSLATTRFALPVLIVFALLSALGALQMGKRPQFLRRWGKGAETSAAGDDPDGRNARAAV